MFSTPFQTALKQEMAANFCSYCRHCKAIKEIDEAAERRRHQFEEEVNERRLQMEEELEAEKRRLMEEGVIYGDQYEAYSVEEIMKITNLDFLYKMSQNMCPSAQPPTEEEFHELAQRCKAVDTRLNYLLLENL